MSDLRYGTGEKVPRANREWIDRVREADRDAEEAFRFIDVSRDSFELTQTLALIAIAAELRAVRIARRPGAGQ